MNDFLKLVVFFFCMNKSKNTLYIFMLKLRIKLFYLNFIKSQHFIELREGRLKTILKRSYIEIN